MRCTHLDQVVFMDPPDASSHARAQGHPILRSIEHGEDWSWCMIDEVTFVLKAR